MFCYNKLMKKILCFGDSNIYGFNPKDGSRYSKNERWSGILASKYNLIEEGCNNRTGFFENPAGIEQTGFKVFPAYLKKHNPETVIIAIGINDLQFQYDASTKDIEYGINNLIDMAQGKDIILIAPSVIKESVLNSFFAQMFDETSIAKSKQIALIYEKTAKKRGIKFINLDNFAEPSDIDGLHYDIKNHKIIAEEIAKNFN